MTFSIQVTRGQLRAALLFSAVKSIRYYLNGVCLDVGPLGDARLVATNVHALCVVKLCDKSDAVPGTYIIPQAHLKSVKRGNNWLSLSIGDGNFALMDNLDILCGGKLIEGKFPYWGNVAIVPHIEAPGTFDAIYLANIQKALIELGSRKGFFYLRHDAVRGAMVNDDLGFLAVVMAIDVNKYVHNLNVSPDISSFLPRPAKLEAA